MNVPNQTMGAANSAVLTLLEVINVPVILAMSLVLTRRAVKVTFHQWCVKLALWTQCSLFLRIWKRFTAEFKPKKMFWVGKDLHPLSGPTLLHLSKVLSSTMVFLALWHRCDITVCVMRDESALKICYMDCTPQMTVMAHLTFTQGVRGRIMWAEHRHPQASRHLV